MARPRIVLMARASRSGEVTRTTLQEPPRRAGGPNPSRLADTPGGTLTPVANAEPGLTTRAAILVEARRCFAEQGFDGTSLNDIAAGVGIRKPSLLHHFTSKEAIYREVFETSLSDWIVRIEFAGDEPDQAGWAKVEHVLDTAFDWFSANPEFVRIMRREALDGQGHLFVANGGIPRTLQDRKVDIHRMDASLVRIDTTNGELLGKWKVADPRLSLRHMAWSRPPQEEGALLGIAMQAEHDLEADRRRAPILAVFDGESLSIPTRENDGIGYAGDIAPALHDGFALSSHQADVANLWHPGLPDRMRPIIQLKAPYAVTGWHGPADGGGILVATAYGLGHWHPSAPPNLLAWPEPMALDNHWILIEEA